MRKLFAVATLSLTSLLGLSMTMCSSSDGTSTPNQTDDTSLVRGHFRGVGAGGNTTAVAEIDVTTPGVGTRWLRPLDTSSGTATIAGSLAIDLPLFGRVDVTGTIDLAANTARFSGTAAGGNVAFEGTISNGVISGTLTVGTIVLPMSLVNEALGGIRLYCGNVAGGLTGRTGIIAAADFAGAAFATTTGQIAGGSGILRAGTLDITLTPTGTLRGQLASDTLTGDWTLGGSSGTFTASEAACAAVGGVLDGGNPSETDGGDRDGGNVEPDGGALGTPETILTVTDDIGVGHVAVDSGKLFFSYRYAQFQQRLRIGVANADGTSAADLVPVNDPLTTPKGAVGSLLVVGSKLYWVNGVDGFPSKLESVAIAGGTPTKVVDLTGQTNPNVKSLVSDGSWIWFSAPRNSGSDAYHGIVAYDLNGTLVAGPAGAKIAPDETLYHDGIALDGQTLFFGAGSVEGGVRSLPKNLVGTPAVIAGQAEIGQFQFVNDIVVDGANVYALGWGSFETSLGRKAKSGSGTMTPIIPLTTTGTCNGLVLVDDYLYFTKRDSQGGQQGPQNTFLYRVAKTATSTAPTKVGPANGWPPVTDGTYVYWSNGKSIMRLHK